MSAEKHRDGMGWYLFLFAVTFSIVAGFLLIDFPERFNEVPYYLTSAQIGEGGRAIGYFVGMAGGLMMLALLFYPLRKRIRLFENFGFLPTWFKWHMVLGILGPTAIIFHSTYAINSFNAGVALVCMLLVSGSGTFGRFFYTKIHHGLYGHQSSLKELEAGIDQTGDIKALLAFAPEVDRQLEEFRVRAAAHSRKGGLGLFSSIGIGFEASSLKRRVSQELLRVLLDQSGSQSVGDNKVSVAGYKHAEYKLAVSNYINALRDVAQFHTYERLFSLWHIFHIPLVYMMVFSAIYHVYAVHAY